MKFRIFLFFIKINKLFGENICEDCDYDYDGEDSGGKKSIVVKSEEELDRKFPKAVRKLITKPFSSTDITSLN